ncbi:hypothetical protein Xaut_2261 [Xanthobacter versatilis]|uniref:TraB/GumN family protein n=1 Tax=Xanthobacter autotrophicus (strain ATCC BAA-1158 / Py2) TaxID=78245 RepID=A7IHL1_XANP2|nr:hypothetical protein Xaut_2261 [Xanthobacter autotrophicus Py2]
MKRSVTFHNGTLAVLALAALAPVPASAQRSVEFGYKDRIFEQNYVLPEPLDEQHAMLVAMLAMTRPGVKRDGQMGLPARHVVEAMGGACFDALYPDPFTFEKTPVQLELERIGNVKVPGDTGMGGSTSRTDRQLCLWQMALFDAAFADSLSTDTQLESLAQHIRQRYRTVWASAADVADPVVLEGARRATLLAIRIKRLQRLGVDTPTEAQITAKSPQVGFVDGLRWLAQDEPYATFDRELTGLEAARLQAAMGGTKRQGTDIREPPEQAQVGSRDTPVRSAGAPPVASPAPLQAEHAESCQQGNVCRVIAVTLFCRTPQQMAAILSQRPGPARKRVLTVLAASGDCRQVAQGETLQWTAPIAMVQPQGEPMAELVPGTLADGTAGFLLKDGVIARTGVAAR